MVINQKLWYMHFIPKTCKGTMTVSACLLELALPFGY